MWNSISEPIVATFFLLISISLFSPSTKFVLLKKFLYFLGIQQNWKNFVSDDGFTVKIYVDYKVQGSSQRKALQTIIGSSGWISDFERHRYIKAELICYRHLYTNLKRNMSGSVWHDRILRQLRENLDCDDIRLCFEVRSLTAHNSKFYYYPISEIDR